MLTLLLGTDWIANRDAVFDRIARDTANGLGGRILMVPELISHDAERRLCAAAGDTASRYAEVLSFTRLTKRVADYIGCACAECLDKGGRVVAMASSARQLHSRLKAYASVETKPEFLTGVLDAVDEFKRCCITAADLKAASLQTQGSLAQKLEELSLLLETYDSHCQRGKRDPRDQMTWLLEQLEDCDFGRNHTFYIDGFPDFTRQHMAILRHLIEVSPHVVVSLNCDKPGSEKLAFEKAGSTAAELLRCAKTLGVEVNICQIPSREDCLSPVRDRLFQGSIQPMRENRDTLRLYGCDSIHQECVAAAHHIRQLVRSGARYRDCGVVCADMANYGTAVNRVFRRSGIPLYLSGTEDILEKPVMSVVLSALDGALNGFDRKDILRYAKSVLSPLTLEESDRLENYVIMWSVTGTLWLKDWTFHPDGLGEQWDENSEQELAKLNRARALVMEPLVHLQDGFRSATNLRQQVRVLYDFLREIQLAQKLDDLARQMEADGDGRNAQILNQLWEILVNAIEQLYDVLGETVWDGQTFARLLRLLLSQYDVGTIPTVLDCVSVGPVEFMRCQQVKHLFVLGASEGNLPGYTGSAGILTDRERTALRQLGVPLTGGNMEGMQAHFGEIYGVFCGAQNSISMSYSGAQPGFVYRRLLQLAGGEIALPEQLGVTLGDQMDAGAYLAAYQDLDGAKQLGIENSYQLFNRRRNHSLGNISEEVVKKLYGTSLWLSASQVDLQAGCRLAYFLKYGLRAKERKALSVDPAEFGTYVHAVLEQTLQEVMQRGGFARVSLDETMEIALQFSADYAQQRFQDLDSQRMTYLFRRNVQELEMIVRELWEELCDSEFSPVAFELGFGKNEQMPPVDISGQKMNAIVRGYVDRVDVWNRGDCNYFRVVDYKTGKKEFDYCDVFNGLGLQMLLYLFALEQGGKDVLGDNRICAGVQYFPARAPLVSADGVLSEEEAEKERRSIWKRRGLLLEDEDVLQAMEPCDKPKRTGYTRRADGSISGDLASRQQFAMLKEYIFKFLGRMVDEIASGQVDPNPYCRGNTYNVCTYCPYGSVCHPDTLEGRRNYQAMTASRFWEEIGKEWKDNG